MMNKTRMWLTGPLVLAVVIGLATRAANAQDAGQERTLIAVLKSDAPKSEKAITCKRLAVYGTKNAVPELARLLSDEQLTSWARIALEAIPDPSVDEVLRDAMNSISGRPLIGVINSIATRRDVQAVDGLVKHLKNTDEQIAVAAAVALGHIGDADAQQALESSLSGGPDAVRSAVAEGCILVAERLLESGQAGKAAELYDKVRTADVPEQRVLEAIRGAIIARESIPLLTEQLRSPNKERFGLGLRTARELSGAKVTNALVSALEHASPLRQGLIVLSLAERDGETVLPAILQAANSGSKNVRVSAMAVLGRVGDASSVSTLLDAAIVSDADVAQAAMDALASLQDQEVNQAVTKRLATAKGQMRRALIEVVGLRQIKAVAELLKAADDADQRIRSAALTALGATIGPDDLSLLINRVTDSKYKPDSEVARQALRAACIRMPDRESCADQLTNAMVGTPISVQSAIVEILASVGGKKALETVGKAAADNRAELKDIASQSLGKWMTPDAAPVLLKLAQPKADERYRIRALRGYIRIARQMKLTDAQRAEMCDLALQAAARDAERKLVLQALQIHPSANTLVVAVSAKKIPSIKEAAAQTAVAIAQQVAKNPEEARKLLESGGGLAPVNIEILQATYGAGGKTKVVTNVVKNSVGKLPIVSLSSASYNASFGGDPAPGVVKQLVVVYKINGKKGEASFPENSVIILPMPE